MTVMSLQGENARSKEWHTDLSAAVNICFLQAPRTNTLLQGSKCGSYRQTKLLELIIQSSPQELFTHFIFFNLKEQYYLSRNLLSPQKYNPSTKISHQQKKKKREREIKCHPTYCFPFSVLYTDIRLIQLPLYKKNHYSMGLFLPITMNDSVKCC